MMNFSADPRAAEQEMHALLFCLASFGYVDGTFDASEKSFIRSHVRSLVEHRARAALQGEDHATARESIERWTRHFHEVLDQIDNDIRSHLTESVAFEETSEQFVTAKLKLRCFELFRAFDDERRGQILKSVAELIHADGVVHPLEAAFQAELESLLNAPIELGEADIEHVDPSPVVIDDAKRILPKQPNHPFFTTFEFDYALDKPTFERQTQADMKLMADVMDKLDQMRARGAGRLQGAADFTAFAEAEPFLDQFVHVVPPKVGRDYELIVIGDLHGCYSCLKAALLQADFFTKVEAYRSAPDQHPDVKLVLLGDYIDRGRFSYSGVLRTALTLFLTVPEHVIMLRGNHEYYIEHKGRILAPVRPAEAIMALADIAPTEVFASYMHLFEALPHILVFDKLLFVHGGIPRQDTLEQKWTGLESLNDPDLRFQMLWSDPSEADVIPLELQTATARFPFGRLEYKAFMARLGCTTMVRGHERVVEGFRRIYDDPEAMLLSLFSAGGATNKDLPETSNYREVTPMALTIRYRDGASQITPFVIDYERYNDPQYNSFFRGR